MKAPRSIRAALRDVRAEVAPPTLLAAVQMAWPEATGERISSEAQPVAERAGVITIACSTATWAQELDLLQAQILERLNASDEVKAHGGASALRFTADAARHADPLASGSFGDANPTTPADSARKDSFT